MVMSTKGVNYTGSIPELNTFASKNESAPSASAHPQRRLSLQNIHDLAYANSLKFRSNSISSAARSEQLFDPLEKMLAGNDPIRRSSVDGSVHTLVNADTQRTFPSTEQSITNLFASGSAATIVQNTLLFPAAPALERHVTFADTSASASDISSLGERISVLNSSDVPTTKAPEKTRWSAVKVWFHDHASTLKTIAKVIAAVVVVTAGVGLLVAGLLVPGLGTALAIGFVAVVGASLLVGGAMAAYTAYQINQSTREVGALSSRLGKQFRKRAAGASIRMFKEKYFPASLNGAVEAVQGYDY